MHSIHAERMLVAISRANASSPFVRIYLFLVISHHVVHVFFVRRSDTSSHRAEKCMSFLIKERLHAPEGSDMFTLSEITPLIISRKDVFELVKVVVQQISQFFYSPVLTNSSEGSVNHGFSGQ